MEDIKVLTDNLMKEFTTLREMQEKADKERAEYGTVTGELQAKLNKLTETVTDIQVAIQRAETPAESKEDKAEAERKAYTDFLRTGVIEYKDAEAIIRKYSTEGLTERKNNYIRALESKTHYIGSDPNGGYLIAPPDRDPEMLKNIIEFSPIRQYAKVVSSSSGVYEYLRKVTDQANPAKVAELGTRSATTNATFGLERIPVKEYHALIQISRHMLQDSAFDIESFINMEAGEQFGEQEGTDFVSGVPINGAPEGLLTNADVSYVATGHATQLKFDALRTVITSVKSPYLSDAAYFMNRLTWGTIMNMKDGNGNYLIGGGDVQQRPLMVLHGFPVVLCTDLASPTTAGDVTFSASAYPIIFGSMRRAYTVVDRMGMEVLRDPYTTKATGIVDISFFRRVGGGVVKPEAIYKIKIAAS